MVPFFLWEVGFFKIKRIFLTKIRKKLFLRRYEIKARPLPKFKTFDCCSKTKNHMIHHLHEKLQLSTTFSFLEMLNIMYKYPLIDNKKIGYFQNFYMEISVNLTQNSINFNKKNLSADLKNSQNTIFGTPNASKYKNQLKIKQRLIVDVP